jgi:hypothetical protein
MVQVVGHTALEDAVTINTRYVLLHASVQYMSDMCTPDHDAKRGNASAVVEDRR